MKRLKILFALFLMLGIGTTAWAEIFPTNFTKKEVTSLDQFVHGGKYVFQHPDYTDRYFCSDKNVETWNATAEARFFYQWEFVLKDPAAPKKEYALTNAVGKYIGPNLSEDGNRIVMQDEPSYFEISTITVNGKSGFALKNTETGEYMSLSESLHWNTGYISSNNDERSVWKFYRMEEPVYVPTVRVATLEEGKNYMIFNAAMEKEEDLTGFIGKNSDNKVNSVKNRPSTFSGDKAYLWKVTKNDDGTYKLISVYGNSEVNAEGNFANEDLYIVNYANNPKKCYDGISALLENETTTKVSSSIASEDKLWAIHNGTNGWNGDKNGFKSASDAFEPYAFYEVREYTYEKYATYKYAELCLTKTGVGFPKTDAAERTALTNAAVADPATADWTTTLNAALTAFKTTSNIQLPADGKSYRIWAVYGNGETQPLYFNGTRITAKNEENITDKNSMKFVCRVEDGKCVLVNNDGQYLLWSDSGPANVNKGLNGNCCSDKYVVQNDWTIGHAELPTEGDYHDQVVAEDFFGRLQMNALGGGTSTYYLAARYEGDDTDCEFISENSADRWYDNGGTRSHTFMFEEVEYPNTPTLNADPASKLGNLATFSAPFATVVPSGVTAYVGTLNGDYVSMTALADGEAIPANTGVMLVGPAGKTTMLPATTETAATVSSNAFGHSAGAAVTLTTNDYILSAVDGEAAFYLVDGSDLTLPMNKAYLIGNGTSQVVKMNFGGEATGIGCIETLEINANAPIYDLSGRRVTATAKGGIYIQNGKKFIVK